MKTDRTADLLMRMARLIAADGYERGLKPVQWQALRFVRDANRFSRTPSGLTAWLGQTKGSVSQTISVLAAKGLLVRSNDMADHRIVRLSLTPEGRAFLAAQPIPTAEAMLAGLAHADHQRFSRLVKDMLLGYLNARNHRAFGMCGDCRHFEGANGKNNLHHCKLLDTDLSDEDAQMICVEQEAA